MNKLTLLWQGAAYQDHLLQSYRKLSIVLQSALLTIGALLFIGAVVLGNSTRAWLTYWILVMVTLLALYVKRTMKRLIAARSEDVNYYHNQIIEAEQQLPKDQQVLTAFKVYQQYGRNEADTSSHFINFELTPTVQKQLIEKGKGHTRQVLDRNIPIGFLCVWACLHIVALLLLFLN